MSLLTDLTVHKAHSSEGIHELTEQEFMDRFEHRFRDPYFDKHRDAIHDMAKIAFRAHKENRKAPIKEKAGPGYKDPSYELADDWVRAKSAVVAAQKRHDDKSLPRKVLVISGADRNDKTCPGEVSKSRRLAQLAQITLETEFNFTTELVDLSLITSEFGKTIHPCKGCVSTAMPLCHFPCSCYPNYSLGQDDDWMNELYPKFVESHGLLFVTPVYWYQAPSGLKLLIDRLVCVNGGNPDPTSTHGKNTVEAKRMEAAGWDYPQHLEKRIFGCMVHGDAGGVESVKDALSKWAQDLGMILASTRSQLARYIGWYEPYYASHTALDRDENIKEEMRMISRSIAQTVIASRDQNLDFLDPDQKSPREK